MGSRERDGGHRTLPPGQHAVKRLLRWGQDHVTIGPVPKINRDSWTLSIEGAVEKPQELGWIDILKLPKAESVSNFHCVEGWSVLDLKWEGIRFKNVVDLAKPTKKAEFVTFECADGYKTSLSLHELLGEQVLLAYKLNGKYLEEDIGAPLRLVVPHKYAYKSAMWITKIRLTMEKETGYWESRGYSDSADVWRNDRFSR